MHGNFALCCVGTVNCSQLRLCKFSFQLFSPPLLQVPLLTASQSHLLPMPSDSVTLVGSSGIGSMASGELSSLHSHSRHTQSKWGAGIVPVHTWISNKMVAFAVASQTLPNQRRFAMRHQSCDVCSRYHRYRTTVKKKVMANSCFAELPG